MSELLDCGLSCIPDSPEIAYVDVDIPELQVHTSIVLTRVDPHQVAHCARSLSVKYLKPFTAGITSTSRHSPLLPARMRLKNSLLPAVNTPSMAHSHRPCRLTCGSSTRFPSAPTRGTSPTNIIPVKNDGWVMAGVKCS